MTRRTMNTEEITEALVLNEAGYTALAIAQRLGFGHRTIQRQLSEHGAKKGSLMKEVIEKAKAELYESVTSNEAIKLGIAKLIVDDLAYSNHIRAVLAENTEYLKAKTLPEAALVMRALAAASTALKNTSDMLNKSLGADKIVNDAGEIPMLEIVELTNEELKEIASRDLAADYD